MSRTDGCSRAALARHLERRLRWRSQRAAANAPEARLTYQALAGRWYCWVPCAACGGAKVPLRDRSSVPPGSAGGASPGPDLHGLPCPACESYRRRREPAGADPAVWYDAALADWVVRLPCGSSPTGVLLPLEIGFFDASWAEVYRAAADIAFSGDALQEEPLAFRRAPRP